MNASQWQSCRAPDEMLRFLRPTASDRQLRLFACACCRNVWLLLATPASRRAVEVSERFADGFISAATLKEAQANARPLSSEAEWLACWATADAAGSDPWDAALWSSAWAAEAAADATARWALRTTGAKALADRLAAAIWEEARAVHCALLRDIFGNPFQRIAVQQSWLLWKNGRVVREARAIYDQRGFDHFPQLAQLLEAAGCDDPDILSHCRSPRRHVRGCWVIDLLLGEQLTRTGDGNRLAAWMDRRACAPQGRGGPPRWYPPSASALLRRVL